MTKNLVTKKKLSVCTEIKKDNKLFMCHHKNRRLYELFIVLAFFSGLKTCDNLTKLKVKTK